MDTRPPPTQAPRGYFNRAYRTNLRPVVIGVSALSALFSLFSSRIKIDEQRTSRVPYGTECFFDNVLAFGVAAAALQYLYLVRVYACLSLVTILLTVGGGIFQVVVHFTSKADIIKECTELVGDASTATYPFGFFGPSRHDSLNPADATAWCNQQYDRNSWQNIISLLVSTCKSTFFRPCSSLTPYPVLVCSFFVLAWGYYRQVLDPTSVVNFSRAPSNQIRLAAFPWYNQQQPYNASVPNLGYGAPYGGPPQQQYAPPPGGKSPGYSPSDVEAGAGYGYGDDKENPFADFDERTERDVTSRPAPGGRHRF
ncbi:hypothetical protein C8F04DRAFT_1244782 [Mycena alexandri]|uniref:Uncharacterized protein n=1 Tax=Mycena alexandri TaxID=1745969 RepID=A0AAD6RYJ0_9AGAR|nr:hypothetical protein C8F04DRAFT_1244782 [Mycena alexandri]